jgi:hypothetical protein
MNLMRRVLRRIFGPKKEEVPRGLRKVHNEDFHDLYSLPAIISMIKLRRIRWIGHVARMRMEQNVGNKT